MPACTAASPNVSSDVPAPHAGFCPSRFGLKMAPAAPASSANSSLFHSIPMSQPPLPPQPFDMPVPSGDQLKASRLAAGLSQAQAAELMGYPLQTGSRGGVQSRTWQALESMADERNMQGPVYAMFLLLTGQHPGYVLTPRTARTVRTPDAG